MLTSGSEGITHLAGSPGGGRLAFVAWEPASCSAEVRVVGVSTGAIERAMAIEKPVLADYRQPLVALAWSPDEKWLYCAFSIEGEHRYSLRLWRTSVDGEEKSLIASRDGVVPLGLSMNPDGRRLALSTGTESEGMITSISLLQINSG